MPPPSMASSLRGPFVARRFARSTRRSESRPGMFCLSIMGLCRGRTYNSSVSTYIVIKDLADRLCRAWKGVEGGGHTNTEASAILVGTTGVARLLVQPFL